jgi:hypothetical protein
VAKPTGRPVTTVPFDRAIHTPRNNAKILENLMLAGTTSQVAGARHDISRRPAGHAGARTRNDTDFKIEILRLGLAAQRQQLIEVGVKGSRRPLGLRM